MAVKSLGGIPDKQVEDMKRDEAETELAFIGPFSYSFGLFSYGLCSYGLCSYGLYSFGLCSYGLCSYGLYSYGLCYYY